MSTDEADRQARKLGLSAVELRALIKPLFMLLHKHGKTALLIRRKGTVAKVEIE